MATKVTIDELVTKFLFEVDPAGAKKYEEQLKKSTGEHKKETRKQQREEDTAQKKTSRRLKQRELLVKRSAERETRARRAANLAQTQGDQRAARQQERIASRASRAKIRAERRVTRELAREQRKRARTERGKRVKEAVSGSAIGGTKIGGGLASGLGSAAALGPAGAALAGGAAAIAATGAAVRLVGDETERLDKIAKGAQQTGLGFESYQRLSQVATLSGTSIEQLSKGTIRLNRNLADVAAGRGPKVAENLEKIGLQLSDLEGVDPTQQLAIISDALRGVDSDVERTAISIELLGRSGADLAPLLNSGSVAIKEMSDSVGRVFTREELARAEAYQDALANLRKSTDLAKGGFVVGLAPSLQSIVELITKAIPVLTDFADEISSGLRESFGDLADSVGEFNAGAGIKLKDVLRAISVPLRALLGLLSLFVDAFNLVVTAANTLLAVAQEIVSFFTDRWGPAFQSAANTIQELVRPLDDVLTRVRGIFDSITEMVGKIEGLQTLVARIRGALPGDEEDKKDEQKQRARDRRDENAAKSAQDRLRARDKANREQRRREDATATAAAEKEFKRQRKARKGSKRRASGLEAQLDQQIGQLAAQAEIRASAQALKSGAGSKEAFQAGRDAAKQTESQIRNRFEETGELPIGIERDITRLAQSPSVEAEIGRVPPPVISVKNEDNSITINNPKITNEIMAQVTSAGELAASTASEFARNLREAVAQARDNLDPRVRV